MASCQSVCQTVLLTPKESVSCLGAKTAKSLRITPAAWLRRLDEIIVFRQLSKSEVKEIADIMLREVFHRAEIKGIKIDVTERFKVLPIPRHLLFL